MRTPPFRHRHEGFTVWQVPALRDNYVYLVAGAGREALVVDPAEAEVVIRACETLGLRPVAILNTHHHWDHTGGNAGLAARYGCRVVAPGEEPPPELARVAGAIGVIPVPGHTRDHVAYRIDDALFCGDTLFGAGCGRLFEGSAAEMWASLRRLAALPPETRLYCAHEYTLANLRFAAGVDGGNPRLAERIARDRERRRRGEPTVPSTLAEELATNPFLRPLDAAFCTAYAEARGTAPEPEAVFADLRRRKDAA